jgi:putative transposase
MQRLTRLDVPGMLHHFMSRGIERKKIFLSDTDRNDFIDRLSALFGDGAMEIYT